MKYRLLLICFILFWVAFAVRAERDEQKNAYTAAQTRGVDSISSALRKIRYCATYDLRTIKWRRSLISAVIITIMLFALLWQRLPSSSELLTHVILITAVTSTMWSSFSDATSSDVAACVDANIAHVKTQLSKNHRFILPSW